MEHFQMLEEKEKLSTWNSRPTENIVQKLWQKKFHPHMRILRNSSPNRHAIK
jgi:hypothetical protein